MIAALGAVLLAAAAVIAVLIAVTGTGIAAAIVLGFTAAFTAMVGTGLLGLALAVRIDRRRLREAGPVGDDAVALVAEPAADPVDAEIEQMINSYRKGGK